MKKQILHVALLDQCTAASYPWAIVVSQVKQDGMLTYECEMRHMRFVRSYKITGLVFGNGKVFARWIQKLINAFEYSNSYYPIELFPRDLAFAETWFDRHFMHKQAAMPDAI